MVVLPSPGIPSGGGTEPFQWKVAPVRREDASQRLHLYLMLMHVGY